MNTTRDHEGCDLCRSSERSPCPDCTKRREALATWYALVALREQAEQMRLAQLAIEAAL